MVTENEFSDAFSSAFDGTDAADTESPCSWPIDYSACGGGLPEPLGAINENTPRALLARR